MSPREVETDGFEVGEVLTGPDDCQIILNYDHQRFILILTKPESPEDDDAVADLFQKLEEAEDDSDDMKYDRCLEDVTELAISTCKHTIHTLAASAQKPNCNQVSLEDFLHPTTFYLQLRTIDGKPQAVRMDDSSELASMHEPVYLEIDHMAQSMPAPIPSVEIEFIEDLFMGKVLKVSKNGEVKYPRNGSQTTQSALTFHSFFGLVKSSGQVIGKPENFIEGNNLYELNLNNASSAQRRRWMRQIEQAIMQLYQRGIVWGDVKPENVVIDKAADAWLVDFGGSSTDGWVDKDLAETVEGDLQGLHRQEEFLGVRH